MIKELVADKELLSTPCEKATIEDAGVAQDLLDTISSLDEVACLAANQIGSTKAIAAYMDEDDEPHIIYNPSLKQALYPIKAEEECFTKEEPSRVTRYGWIKVAYEEDVDGTLVARKREFEGNTAQAIQHLIDHCKGKYV